MKLERNLDEYLEKMWYMKEDKKDNIEDLKGYMQDKFDMETVNELVRKNHVKLTDGKKKITLTDEGEEHTRQLIRAHRLAEKMVHDVLGTDFEAGACEFEHIVTPELIDGICTLLGHPRECPHGMSIPRGNCCDKAQITATRSVIPVTALKVGDSARVAYVNCKSDRRLHKIEGLHIRPGTTVKLHQNYPSFVVECEGANIAMDEDVASSICVWRKDPKVAEGVSVKENGRRGRGFGRGLGRKARNGDQ
jgi:DtxR family transcriptional regulator, Mn-dependent transcriptional regulator